MYGFGIPDYKQYETNACEHGEHVNQYFNVGLNLNTASWTSCMFIQNINTLFGHTLRARTHLEHACCGLVSSISCSGLYWSCCTSQYCFPKIRPNASCMHTGCVTCYTGAICKYVEGAKTSVQLSCRSKDSVPSFTVEIFHSIRPVQVDQQVVAAGVRPQSALHKLFRKDQHFVSLSSCWWVSSPCTSGGLWGRTSRSKNCVVLETVAHQSPMLQTKYYVLIPSSVSRCGLHLGVGGKS